MLSIQSEEDFSLTWQQFPVVDKILDMQTFRLERIQCARIGCIAHTKGAPVAPVRILMTQLLHSLLQLHGAGQMITMQLHQLNA